MTPSLCLAPCLRFPMASKFHEPLIPSLTLGLNRQSVGVEAFPINVGEVSADVSRLEESMEWEGDKSMNDSAKPPTTSDASKDSAKAPQQLIHPMVEKTENTPVRDNMAPPDCSGGEGT